MFPTESKPKPQLRGNAGLKGSKSIANGHGGLLLLARMATRRDHQPHALRGDGRGTASSKGSPAADLPSRHSFMMDLSRTANTAPVSAKTQFRSPRPGLQPSVATAPLHGAVPAPEPLPLCSDTASAHMAGHGHLGRLGARGTWGFYTPNSGVKSHRVQCLKASVLPLPLPTHWMAREAGTACAETHPMALGTAQCLVKQGPPVPWAATLLRRPGSRRQKRNPRFPPNCKGFCFYNCLSLNVHLSFLLWQMFLKFSLDNCGEF